MTNKQTILFLVPYPHDEAPSKRFRFEQYLHLLASHGYTYRVQSFLSLKTWTIRYTNGKTHAKMLALFIGYLKRIGVLFFVPFADYIFIHREATPAGPPIVEWIIAFVFRKKIIYDFDDAIWLTDKSNESALQRFIRFRSKVIRICKWSYKVSCGNEYLRNYANRVNENAVLNPTTIDTERLHNPDLFTKESQHPITLGWTGSHSTIKYLKEIEDVLYALEQRYPTLHFVMIADKKPELKLNHLTFIPWNKSTEANDLGTIDIGIMPLPDNEWTNGKCGFKALQYMAMEIPSVVSPVGVNTKIVEDGVTGFYASTHAEWISVLERLINNAELRNRVGKNGRTNVVNHYSVRSNASLFLSLFS